MRIVVYKETYEHGSRTIHLITCQEKDMQRALEKLNTSAARIYQVEDEDCFDTDRLIATIEYKTVHGDYLAMGTAADSGGRTQHQPQH